MLLIFRDVDLKSPMTSLLMHATYHVTCR